MPVMVIALILIAIAAVIIYKVNNKFEKKEILILLSVVIISIIATILIVNEKEEQVPKIFKDKYEKEKNVTILKFSYKKLNNKVLSSKTNFIYNFSYIIKKDKKELVCIANEVKIKKIEDEFIFENFNNLNEKCTSK